MSKSGDGRNSTADEEESFFEEGSSTSGDSEETLSQGTAANIDLSGIFANFEARKLAVLAEIIEQSKNQSEDKSLPELGEDLSFNQYMDEHRRDIDEEKYKDFYQKLDQIDKSFSAQIKNEMARGDEQILKFDNPNGGFVQIEGSAPLKYKKSDRLKIVEPAMELPSDKAPLCLSLPLQDEYGRNMKAKEAKYLFINYDKTGKISHIIHPEPLKIEGDKCCCEINGKPYYLKIEKKALDALKLKIEQNRGNDLEQDLALRPEGPEGIAERIREELENPLLTEKNLKKYAQKGTGTGQGGDPDMPSPDETETETVTSQGSGQGPEKGSEKGPGSDNQTDKSQEKGGIGSSVKSRVSSFVSSIGSAGNSLRNRKTGEKTPADKQNSNSLYGQRALKHVETNADKGGGSAETPPADGSVAQIRAYFEKFSFKKQNNTTPPLTKKANIKKGTGQGL